MTATFTDRYVAETVRHLPPQVAGDVRAELAGSIADALEVRIGQGEEPYAAERAVLTELGDPAVLAASYADRPLQLIGPRHYLAWRRVLKMLLVVIPATSALVAALTQMGSVVSAWGIVGHTVAAGVMAVIHVCFWVTLLFAVLDRVRPRGSAWRIDQLPQLPRQFSRSTETVIAVASAVMILVVLLQLSLIRPTPLLHPSLWPWWILAMIAITAAEVVVNFLRVRRGWSAWLAVVNLVVMALFTSWFLVLLARGELVNPAMAAQMGIDAGLGTALSAVFGFAVVAGVVWNVTHSWKQVRAARVSGQQ